MKKKKILKNISIFIIIIGLLSIIPSVIITKVSFLNNEIQKQMNKKISKKLKETFNFLSFENKIKNRKQENFILYIGGEFCPNCKNLNKELKKEENKNLNTKIEKIYFNSFFLNNENIKMEKKIEKDFRNTDEWNVFWKKIIDKYYISDNSKELKKNWKKNVNIPVPFFIFFEWKDNKHKINSLFSNPGIESLKQRFNLINKK